MGHIRLLIDENEELTIEALTNLFELLSNKTVGENVFPTMWKGLNHKQVQQLMQCIYGRSAVSVDWRTESVLSHESIQEIYDRVGGGGGEKGEDSITVHYPSHH
uniref:Uncharacterized protein n=1 Tax=Amphimedon queenslandica TaxID=400682 RepID=A0A1X7U4H1_AMPQE